MRHWLLTQAMVFFPLLTFCFMLAVLFIILPDDDAPAPPLLETTATDIALTQKRTDGGEVNMAAASLTRAADGGVRIAGLQLNITLANGVLVLKDDNATLNEETKELTLPSAAGELQTAGRRAILSFGKLSYRLTDGMLTGGAVSITEANNKFSGKSFTFSTEGNLIMQGDIKAVFPPME